MNEWMEADTWNQRSESYTNRMERWLDDSEQQLWSHRLHSLLGEAGALHVLDIGTGSGFLAIPLSRLGHQVTGLDFSEDMLRIAAKRSSIMGLDCNFVHGRADELPFADEAFDAIVSRHLLPYLSDRPYVLEEWLRVLKPDGRLVIWDGDWIARNIVPYALKKRNGLTGSPRRQGIVKRQGQIRRFGSSNSLRHGVTEDLIAAGFCDIQSCELEEAAISGLGRAVTLACEKIVISARKP
ncbi:class I SAM-dependent methyltransferase [Paenibacillus sp. sgz302251]|uniref:class I SAM-dependent methyltransferase n=1 Tax=Paenibacillus sp. sgz302251 TaxID=3414493 RepID=UPI003C7E19E0